jgi:hypothetical protein
VGRSGTLGTEQKLDRAEGAPDSINKQVKGSVSPISDTGDGQRPPLQGGPCMTWIPRVPLRSIRRGGLSSVARSALIPQFAIRVSHYLNRFAYIRQAP